MAVLLRLRSTRWFDMFSKSFEVHYTAYNEDVRMFSMSEIIIRFDQLGFATHSAYTWAIPAESYNQLGVLVADALFVLLLLIPLKGEAMDLFSTVRSRGCRGFREYWGFWNAVDWFSIVAGIAMILIWILL